MHVYMYTGKSDYYKRHELLYEYHRTSTKQTTYRIIYAHLK